MDLAERSILIEIFQQSAAAKRREARLLEAFELAFVEHKERERREDDERQKFYEEFIAATKEQIAAFSDRLDHYDTATVQALMDNERDLTEVRERRSALESSAFRLPDGRMVFKTEDGERVFDQHGNALSADIVDPDSIPDKLPKWEAFKAVFDREDQLLRDRQELCDFQKRVDDAREAISKNGVSKKELDALGADLDRNMPDAVRRRLAGETPDLQPVAAQDTRRAPDFLPSIGR